MSLISALSRQLRAVPALHRLARKVYRLFLLKARPLEVELRLALRRHREVFFIQVGSNDGAQGDPIYKLVRTHPRWKGMFIEPVPFLFQRLKDNYANNSRFIFENVAIGGARGDATFYYVSERAKQELGDAAPYWYDQLGSFDRNHIVKHLDGLLAPYIVEVQLPCLQLQELIDRNGVQRIDLLHIDTEGYDYQVLQQFDFARYQPRAVLYEHKHLNTADRQQAQQLLLAHGYLLQTHVNDTLAVLDAAPRR